MIKNMGTALKTSRGLYFFTRKIFRTIFALIFIIFNPVSPVFSDTTNITAVSVDETCYTPGGTLTINYTLHNRYSWGPCTLESSIIIVDSSDTTPDWNDPAVWTSAGAVSSPDTDGHTGYDEGGAAANGTIAVSHTVNIPSGWSGDGTKRILILFGDQTRDITMTDQYNEAYVEVDTSLTLDECSSGTSTVTETVTETSIIPSATDTPTFTPTYTATDVLTDTPTTNYTNTFTPTFTPTFTATPTFTPTPTFTATPTFTPTPTYTATGTPTNTPLPDPEVSIVKSANVTEATIGDTITYCIEYENTGGGEAIDFKIWDTVPDATTYIDCDSGCTQSGGIVSWTITSIVPTGTGTVCFWVQVTSAPFYNLHELYFALTREKGFAEGLIEGREYTLRGITFRLIRKDDCG